jgi:hypothetical protein
MNESLNDSAADISKDDIDRSKEGESGKGLEDSDSTRDQVSSDNNVAVIDDSAKLESIATAKVAEGYLLRSFIILI